MFLKSFEMLVERIFALGLSRLWILLTGIYVVVYFPPITYHEFSFDDFGINL